MPTFSSWRPRYSNNKIIRSSVFQTDSLVNHERQCSYLIQRRLLINVFWIDCWHMTSRNFSIGRKSMLVLALRVMFTRTRLRYDSISWTTWEERWRNKFFFYVFSSNTSTLNEWILINPFTAMWATGGSWYANEKNDMKIDFYISFTLMLRWILIICIQEHMKTRIKIRVYLGIILCDLTQFVVRENALFMSVSIYRNDKLSIVFVW